MKETSLRYGPTKYTSVKYTRDTEPEVQAMAEGVSKGDHAAVEALLKKGMNPDLHFEGQDILLIAATATEGDPEKTIATLIRHGAEIFWPLANATELGDKKTLRRILRAASVQKLTETLATLEEDNDQNGSDWAFGDEIKDEIAARRKEAARKIREAGAELEP